MAVVSRLRADFQTNELSAVLARYDIGHVDRVDRQLRGSRRAPKVILTTSRGRYLLKRRARGKDHPLKVAYSHAVQHFLVTQGFPTPRLVTVRGGSDTVVVHGDLTYELFEYVTGMPYGQSLTETFDSGRWLGIFHKLLAAFHSDWEPTRRGYHDSNAVRSNLTGIPVSVGKDDSVVGRESELLAVVSQLFDAYEDAAEKVEEAGFADWPAQIVHADWHPGNILFRDNRVVAVIDYDSLHMLPTITDLANGLLQFSILGGPVDPRDWPAELDENRFARFLMGYAQEAPVAREQFAVVCPLMIQALIAEAVVPIAATGSFGRLEGFRFLQMIARKVHWLQNNAARLSAMLRR